MIGACAELAAALSWDELQPETRSRLPLVVLDALGSAVAAGQRRASDGLAGRIAASGGRGDAWLWSSSERVPAAHAALVNAALTHHFELDDGCPRASVHGGSTIIPAAIACAETTSASGRDLLVAIAAGYAVAVACGRPLRDGIDAHNLHPPAMLGAFGATAAAGRLFGLRAPRLGSALNLAATMIPIAPFEAFARGATVKDLYAGWPAFIGVTAALLAGDGLDGPSGVFGRPHDGLGTFLAHAPIDALPAPDPDEILGIEFKRYAACRAVHATLTALETLLPVAAANVSAIDVETYPFPIALSADADASTPIGAQTSIPYCVASMVLDGGLGPDAFGAAALADPVRRSLALRVTVRLAGDMVEPLVRGARVTIAMADGTTRRAAADASRWSADRPATDDALVEKFRQLAGGRSHPLEAAALRLAEAPDVHDLVAALRAVVAQRDEVFP